MAAVTICSDSGAKKIKYDTVSTVSPSISHEVMGPDAEQRLIEFCKEKALVRANTLFQQHKRRLYTRPSPDGQHRNQNDFILCSQRWRRPIQSTKTRQGTDCGSDHGLLIDKFRLKLKKVGKTTRPFRYDRNKIPYYTVKAIDSRD